MMYMAVRAASVFIFILATASLAGAQPQPAQAAEEQRLRDVRGVADADLNEDGSRVFVRLRNGEISLWDVAEGTRIEGELDSAPAATCYAMSGDGRFVVVGFEAGSRVFDAATGAAVSPPLDVRLQCQLRPNAVFSPDGATLVMISGKEATVWKVTTGEKLAAIALGAGPHEDAPAGASFTATGAHCFVMGPDGVVTRFETQSWTPAGKPMQHPAAPSAYDFAFEARADGNWLATFDGAGENGPKGHLQIWDGLASKKVGAPLVGVNGFSAKFLPDPPRVIVEAARGNASVRALPSLKVLYSIPAHDDVEGPSIAVTPDAKWLVTWGSDRSLKALDAATGKMSSIQPDKATIRGVILAPDSSSCFVIYDNSTFATSGFQDHYVMRLRLPELNVTGAFRSSAYLGRVSLSRNGRRLLVLEGSGDEDQRVLVFNARDMMPVGNLHE